QRNVSATVIVDFSDPLGSGGVPVTDLVTLGGERPLRGFLTNQFGARSAVATRARRGGSRPLRGFLANQFVDRSAAAMRLEYRWPVAVWLDGSLLYEAGSVFGDDLEGFDFKRFRNSYGFGLVAVGATDHAFQALVALGTKSW